MMSTEKLTVHNVQDHRPVDVEKQQATVEVTTWFRESTGQWVGEVRYRANDTSGVARYTGETEEAARNAAFAAVGCLLLATTWDV